MSQKKGGKTEPKQLGFCRQTDDIRGKAVSGFLVPLIRSYLAHVESFLSQTDKLVNLFCQNFPELKQRKEVLESRLISNAHFSYKGTRFSE